MIKHVFMFALKEFDEKTLGQAREAIEGLRQLPMVGSLEFGADMGRTRLSYDAAVIVCFDNMDALAEYQSDPSHREVIELLRGWCDRVAIVDYEVSA